MAVTKIEKEIPWCTIFLVAATLTCHSLVLSGNLATASAMHTMGASTGGWSSIGVSLSESVNEELDTAMSQVSTVLTNSIKAILQVQDALDTVLGLTGSVSDVAVAAYEKEVRRPRLKAPPALSQVELGHPVKRAVNLTRIMSRPKQVTEAPKSLLDEEVVFMAQMPVRGPKSKGASVRSRSKVVARPLPKWNKKSVLYLSSVVHRRSIGIWKLRKAADKERNQSQLVPSPQEYADILKQVISKFANETVGRASTMLASFLSIIKPALLQIGKWLISFGDKIQEFITGFATSLDNVQKIFDQIMAKLSRSAGEGEEQMLYDTFTLFCSPSNPYITITDLKDVSTMYGISALQGQKSDTLFAKYDADHNGKLFADEYALFVHDESIPGAMSLVLRTYATKMATISGNIKAARMRDELANAVYNYLALVCAKNMTKVGWVSQTLTNRSLPMQFTSALLKNMALNVDNPNVLTTADVGAIIVGQMVHLNAPYVGECLNMVKDPAWWSSEGFEPLDQPVVVERVTRWIAQSPGGDVTLRVAEGMAAGGALLQTGANASQRLQEQLVAMPALSHEELLAAPQRFKTEVQARQLHARKMALVARRQKIAEQVHTKSSHALRMHILGAFAGMSLSGDDPAQQMAVNSGQPAAPESLVFGARLASNSSATSNTFQKEAFDYSSESSSPLDSFANKIKGMTKKVATFLDLMEQFATPTAIDRLEQQVLDFASGAAKDVIDFITRAIDDNMDKVVASLPDDIISQVNATLARTVSDARQKIGVGLVQKDSRNSIGAREDFNISAVWTDVTLVLTTLQSILPTVVSNLKQARTDVSSFAATLDSIFKTFQSKGPPIFYKIAKLYKMLWVVYFALFAVLTAAVLFYGLWASGWCGGPQSAATVAEDEEDYERPRTFGDRCRACCNCCDACLRGCHDSHLCFWSVVILMEIIVLVLFVVAIVLCLLAGIKAFISSGCAQVYLLGDDSICTGVLGSLRRWLLSFLTRDTFLITDACQAKTLLTCELIGKKMKTSAIKTTIGSLAASILSFQMIVESAILHERARWRRIFNEASKSA
mmetsp:Transcript_21481/g.49984  ORF Transcript_21481/g.49984 Transcript_21481/m.49984 type:complete len:1062 (+) Transcript_21481:66-3251(+)